MHCGRKVHQAGKELGFIKQLSSEDGTECILCVRSEFLQQLHKERGFNHSLQEWRFRETRDLLRSWFSELLLVGSHLSFCSHTAPLSDGNTVCPPHPKVLTGVRDSSAPHWPPVGLPAGVTVALRPPVGGRGLFASLSPPSSALSR